MKLFEICDPQILLDRTAWQIFYQSDSVDLVTKNHF